MIDFKTMTTRIVHILIAVLVIAASIHECIRGEINFPMQVTLEGDRGGFILLIFIQVTLALVILSVEIWPCFFKSDGAEDTYDGSGSAFVELCKKRGLEGQFTLDFEACPKNVVENFIASLPCSPSNIEGGANEEDASLCNFTLWFKKEDVVKVIDHFNEHFPDGPNVNASYGYVVIPQSTPARPVKKVKPPLCNSN